MADRTLNRLTALLLGAALLATLAWVVATLASRPLDGVEGDVLFEASRMRGGLRLYVDPAVGAHDYGAIPARYLVLYPPLWAALLSIVPTGAAPAVARIVAAGAWFGVLAWIAHRARARQRLETVAPAVFLAGSWTLALYGASGRPDAIAVAFAGVAVARAAEKGRLDALCGALFAIAAWLKPNVIGAAPGAFFAAALAAGSVRAVLRGLFGASAVTAAVAGVLTAVSGRAWLDHLLASTGQEPSLGHWVDQILSRAPFFGLPLAAALFIGWRGRRDTGTAIATGALASSTLWTVLSLSKIGSASNYFMEPLVTGLVVIAHADLPAVGGRIRLAVAGLAFAQTAWNGVASVKSAIEHTPEAWARGAAIAEARALCGARPSDVVLADEPGLELMANGRIVATPFQSTHLARRGRFPVAAWAEDVSRPEASCLVMQDDLLERPLDQVDREHDRFGPDLRRALGARFVLATERAGLRLYRRRAPDPIKEEGP